MALGLSLERTTRRLQRTVAPGLGDSIIEVWRPKAVATTAPGGAGRDAAGNRVTTNAPDQPADQGAELVGTYYGRFSPIRGGNEQMSGGIPSEVIPFVFGFNAADNPDVRSMDRLVVAIKRTSAQTIAQTGWQPAFAYAPGDREQPTQSNGLAYVRLSGSVSGAEEPDWPTTVGDQVEDGDGKWVCEGPRTVYAVTSAGGPGTFPVIIPVFAERKGGVHL